MNQRFVERKTISCGQIYAIADASFAAALPAFASDTDANGFRIHHGRRLYDFNS